MAVRAVTTDLSAAYSAGSGELTDADATTGFSEPSGTGGTSGDTYADLKSFALDTEFKIEGTGAIGGAWTTNSPERGGVLYNQTFTVPTDGAVLVWMWFIAPTALSAYNIGGMWVGIGNTTSALNIFRVSGNNFDPAPKGGWYCFAVDPSQTAERYEQVGSPNGTWNYVGGGVASTTQMSRGLTHVGVDAIRVGRCKLVVVGGTSTDADADFSSTDTLLEAEGSGSFGIFESQLGSFFMQGMFQFGDNTSGTGEVDFTDSNKSVSIRNTPAVGANFNRFELQDGSTVTSNISLTSCTFSNLGVGNAVAATASRGDWVNTDDVNLTLTACTFVDMGLFTFKSNTTATGTTFRRTKQITQNTATLTGCVFSNCIDAITLVVNDISKVTGNTFESDGSNHAVDLGTLTTQTITWDNIATGYAAGSTGSPITPTSTGNEVITVNVATGNTLTINVAAGKTTPSVRNTAGSPGTINVVAGQVTLTLTGLVANSEVRIYAAGTTTELDGVENSGTSFGYTYTYVAATEVDIVVHKADYKHIRIEDYLLGSGDASLPIQQIFDRNYSNP